MLNQRLIDQQGLTQNEVNAIEDLHKMREKLFANLAEMEEDEIKAQSKEINALIEEIEFLMQDYWKFGRNSDHHTWWYRNDICTCPKMDNDDVLGMAIRYTSCMCPLHGDHND